MSLKVEERSVGRTDIESPLALLHRWTSRPKLDLAYLNEHHDLCARAVSTYLGGRFLKVRTVSLPCWCCQWKKGKRPSKICSWHFPLLQDKANESWTLSHPSFIRERGAHATLWIWDNLHNATLFSLTNNRKWVISSNCFRLEMPQTTRNLQLNVSGGFG